MKKALVIIISFLYHTTLYTGVFVSFDDSNSIAKKVEYAQKKNLKGVMVWHLGLDFNNQLVNAIQKSIGKKQEQVFYIFAEYNRKTIFFSDSFKKIIEKNQSHITFIYAFLKPTLEGKIDYDLFKKGEPFLKRLQQLKKEFPKIKIFVSIGGWQYKDLFFKISENSKLKRFAFNCINFIGNHHFDGIDIDWEYSDNQISLFRKYFPDLILYLQQAQQVRNSNYYITASLGHAISFYKDFTCLKQIQETISWFNIMAYNYEGPLWSEITGHNAPLYSKKSLYPRTWKKCNHFESVDTTIQYLLQMGIKSEKIVLGMPFYGRAFNGVNSKDKKGIYNKHKGSYCSIGKNTSSAVYYKDIIVMLEKDKKSKKEWHYYWDDESQVPYLYKV